MIYNSEPGKIYDTIFFFIELFNQECVERDYIKIYDDTRFMVECFNKVKSESGEIPKLLSPFFYIADGRISPVSAFFSNQMDFQKDNIDSFILKLTTNANLLYQNTVDNIFNHNAKDENTKLMPAIDPANYIDKINDLELPIDFKFQVSLLLGNFNYAISVLAVTMKKIYGITDRLHAEYKREISMEFDQIKSDINRQLYNNALKYEESNFEKTFISISLMNQYIIYYSCKDEKNFSFLFGYKHEETLADKFDISKATAENFILVCGSEVRMKIMMAFMKNGEMTSSQIARYINTPVTTMIRHMSALEENGIIYVSNRDKLQIFYKLNQKLLRKIKVSIDELFSNILDG